MACRRRILRGVTVAVLGWMLSAAIPSEAAETSAVDPTLAKSGWMELAIPGKTPTRYSRTADGALEDLAQDIAVAEPPVAVDRKRRVVRHPVLETEATEPSVGQVHLDLLAQPTLRADRIAVADQEHPDHQLRIDRRAPRMAVVGRKRSAKRTQIENPIDPMKLTSRTGSRRGCGRLMEPG